MNPMDMERTDAWRGETTARFEGGWTSGAQAAHVSSPSLEEFHVCLRPDPEGDFQTQAGTVYARLERFLEEWDIDPDLIVAEKFFFSDIQNQHGALTEVRSGFLRRAGIAEKSAATYVQQPPAFPGRLCELQVNALKERAGRPLKVRFANGLAPWSSAKLVEMDGARMAALANVTGDPTGDEGEIAGAFEQAERFLQRFGMNFRHVARTWIYLRDIEPHYAELNRARSSFFRSRSVRPAPASTGIQGTAWPDGQTFGLDLRAVEGDGVEMEIMRADTLGEAWDYGSDFARGMRLRFRDRTVLYISGTASIDVEGRTLHAGDIEGQTDRMLLNVERLLAKQGASPENLVAATTYLKEREFLEPFRKVCGQRGFSEKIPNTLCIADVCRPEWLVELEAIAVLP